MKQGASFFVIAIFFLALFYGYIESQGGFIASGHGVHMASAQPASASDYHALARQDAIDNHIDPDLFERQIAAESAWNPDAVSRMGAIGIAQIMPSTASGWHVDPHDPVASLSAAAKAMAWYQGHYGSYEKGLACYNAGCDALDRAMARYGADWKIGLPTETQTYIKAIMG